MKAPFVKPLFSFLLILSGYLFLSSAPTSQFKTNQMNFSRVSNAYKEKWLKVKSNLDSKGIEAEKMELYIQVFKKEMEIEVWAKNRSDSVYKKIAGYAVCKLSGNSGPKRRQGDMQVPEGFYHINVFNPRSNFHLSLGLNYPNTSDQILGEKGNLGGDIYIHGHCVTIGCLPITDDKIKELYIYCVEARNNGQLHIPVTIYPARLTDYNFNVLRSSYHERTDYIDLWTDMKEAYDQFAIVQRPPVITFLNNGRHRIE